MFTADLSTIFSRELNTLKEELLAYDNPADIWTVPDGISNSAGTLTLHLAGNLQHFIGALLGGTGYVRQRDAEFADRDVPRGELLQRVDETLAAVQGTLAKLTDAELESAEPVVFGEINVAPPVFAIHLVSHLAFHLGQINYHRRLVTEVRGDVKVVSITGLGIAG